MTDLPDTVAALIAEREAARAARDFAEADRLRDVIRAAGFIVKDGPAGSTWEPAPAYEQVDPRTIASQLGEPPSCTFSFHVLDEGFPGDLERFMRGLTAHNDLSDSEVVIVDNGGTDGARIQQVADQTPAARALHLNHILGYAAARNAGLKTAKGSIIIVVDLSIEPTGDLCAPLRAAFEPPSVGLAGPFGLVTEDLFDFTQAAGPGAHAIEGYFMAMRRELLAEGGLFRDRFTWYRNADIDLSFQLRSTGAEARVVPLPVLKHEHRGWTRFPDDERDRLSRKNHGAFLRRWRDRRDLIEPV